jgi:hypothetical protein
VGGVPPAACILVAQSEHDGGIGVCSTVRKFITPYFPAMNGGNPSVGKVLAFK